MHSVLLTVRTFNALLYNYATFRFSDKVGRYCVKYYIVAVLVYLHCIHAGFRHLDRRFIYMSITNFAS